MSRPAAASFVRLPPPVLTALLDGDLAVASARSGVVEVGCTVLPHLRGRGYARAALAALVAEAAASSQVRVVRASVSPDNAASLAVVRRAGFVHVGEQVDEQDGLELVHELAV